MRLTRTTRSLAASLPLLIATMALIGFVYFVSVPTLAQSPRPVGNEIVTHHVTLSDKITVDIEVDIDAEIKEARLWVKPHGEDKVASYRYVDFEQKERLTATGEIDVHSPSYFPPGTIFDVRFEFVSVDNDIYSSSTYVVEHLGNDHNWQRVSDDLLEIVYYGLNRRSIENLHSRVASRLPEINSALGVTDSPRYRAVIFPNLQELTRHGPRISQAATDGTYFGGFAYDEYNLTIMSSPSAEVLVHEMTHLIFARKLTSPYATAAPGWLNEGNSSFWETGDRRKPSRDFAPFVRSGNVSEFAKMDSVPGLRDDIHRFYIQSADFVGFLLENHGRDSVGKLLDELNTGKEIDEAMQTVFGGTLTQIENEWRREWRLSPVGTSVERIVDIQTDLPATIPGLPTIETGTLNTEVTGANRQTDAIPTPQPEPVVLATSAPRTSELQPQATVAPEQPPAATPIPTPSSVYFTGSPDEEWPTVKPSAIIVFLVLGLGFLALMYRRFKA